MPRRKKGVKAAATTETADADAVGARDALQERETRYHDLIDATGLGFVVLDAQGRVHEANAEYVRLSGHGSLDAILGRSVLEWTADQAKQKHADAIARCVTDGLIRNLEIDYVDAAGHVTPVEIHAASVGSGDDARIVALCRDAAARKRSETDLIRSETRLRSIFERMTEGFSVQEVICDDEGNPRDLRFVDANPAFERQTGLKNADTLGHTLLELFPTSEPYWIERYGHVALSGEPAKFEATFGPLGIVYQANAFQTEPGQFATLFTDISERKRSEDALRESEERWKFALEGSGAGVWDWNLQTGVAVFSTRWKQMLGYADDEIAPRVDEWSARVHPDDLPAVMATIQAHLDGTTPSAIVEHRMQTKAGTWIWILGRGLVVSRDAEGKPLRMVGTNTDVSEQKREHERLLELTDRLHLATASAHEAVWDWDLRTNTMVWDAGMFELYGLTPDTFPGGIEAWQQGLHPEDAARAIAECEAALRGEKPFDTEFRVRHPDGTVVHVKANGLVVRAPDGTLLRMTGVNSDITARKRAELEREALQQIGRSIAASANLDELLAGMHQALRRVMTAENCFVALHDAGTDRYRFPYFVDARESAPGEPLAMPESCMAYVRRRGEPVSITPAVFGELQGRGEVSRVGAPSRSWMGVPLRTPSGVIGVLVVQDYTAEDVYNARDLEFLASVGGQVALIIERKLAEAALRDREEELNVILESTADGLLAVDSAGHVLRTNKRFAQMWSIPDEVLDAKDDARLLAHVMNQLADPAGFVAGVQALYHSNEASRDRIAFADGRVFVRMSTPLVKEGSAVGRVWTFHDITQQVRAEEAKASLESRLHQAEKMESVGRLAGGVAHDFNNMLAVILGYTELALQRVESTDPLHADLMEILRAARQSADVTAQLLTFARKQTVQPVVLHLNEQIPQLLSMLQRLIGEHIRVVWHPSASVWPVWLDAGQLATVLTNLCINARDAIADVGTLTLSTENCVLEAGADVLPADAVTGDYVRLTVSDTGHGMDAATQARIFEPFFTTKGVGEGTGLGLASVYGAVTQSGGFVTVASEMDVGSTFHLYFPRRGDEGTAARGSGAIAAAAVGAVWQEAILLVEDEPAILRLATRVLEGQGYAVLAASSPTQALTLAREHAGTLDLLVSDVLMPEMNGRDLAHALSAVRPGMRHLFMSGHAADVMTDAGRLSHGAAFIAKPFSPAALLGKVREVLDK